MDTSQPSQVIPSHLPDAIGLALDIEPVPSVQEHVQPPVVADASANTGGGDIEIASENLKTLVVKGNQALDQIMEVAELSQHPRAYEVVATTLNALALINRQLLDTAKAKREAQGPAKNGSITNANNVQQNVFVGSTADLAKFLELKNGNHR